MATGSSECVHGKACVRLILTRSPGGLPTGASYHDSARGQWRGSCARILATGLLHHACPVDFSSPAPLSHMHIPLPLFAHALLRILLHPVHSCPYQRISISPPSRTPCLRSTATCLSSPHTLWTCMLQHSLTKTKVLEPRGSLFSDQYQTVGIARRSQGDVEKDEKKNMLRSLQCSTSTVSLQF
jgi:hypothetical protein